VGTDPEPGPVARAFLACERALDDAGGLDFDDLVGRALRVLEARPRILTRWRERCEHLLVDQTQDVDRSQLRLTLLLAAPHNQIFFVGDDDQTIYGWRLADVKRLVCLSLGGRRRSRSNWPGQDRRRQRTGIRIASRPGRCLGATGNAEVFDMRYVAR